MGCLLLINIQAMFERFPSVQPPGGLPVDTTIDEHRSLLTQKNDGFPSSVAGDRIGYGLPKWKLNSTGLTREILVALVKAFSVFVRNGSARLRLWSGRPQWNPSGRRLNCVRL
jgi:hypothetical protein